MAQNRRMCNELIHELCKEIPTTKTTDRILLTARKMYAYLSPLFSKKLIYRDAIDFLKALLKAKKKPVIYINPVAQNKESNELIVVNREQSDEKFELETNKFRVQIQMSYCLKAPCSIFVRVLQFDWAHLHYFLCLITPLIQPFRFNLDYHYSPDIPIAPLVHFMSTQGDWIDSIQLRDYHFDSELSFEALTKYNKLDIHYSLSPVYVPKMIHWLTSKNHINNNNNNNGQQKKQLSLCNWDNELEEGLALLMDELKKEFAQATSTSRFVVRMELRERLDKFTFSNEATGEKLKLRLKKIKYGWYIHALSRSPNNGLDANKNDCAELGTLAEIHLTDP